METNQSKGKNLEQIVFLIQKAFKDSPHTKIYPNHKLITESGDPREFDVIVETKMQGFDLVIAIECKAHKASVGAQLVEGFKAKCDRVSKINKIVFISSSGFQKGAISFAEKQNISFQFCKK